MSTKKVQTIELIRSKLSEADAIVVGGGAGLSAAAGLDYMDQNLFSKKYGMFLKKGYRTIWNGITDNWRVTNENAVSYWGYWCQHINNIYYDPGQLELYKNLYDLIRDKAYFIITTNADGQFYKGDYDPEKVFSMQGSYGRFQCQKGCHQTLYDNHDMVSAMLKGFDYETLEIRKEDVPHCPECGGLLCPNLRVDGHFVENKVTDHHGDYIDFIQSYRNKKLVLLELGVGFNTPSIIRYPFEEMTKVLPEVTLIRVNKGDGQLNRGDVDQTMVIDMNISDALTLLKETTRNLT